MNKIKRIISVILAITLVFSLSGCFDTSSIIDKYIDSKDKTNKNYSPVEKVNINVPYISNDSLNPYAAQTEINRNLTTLLYDSLYEVGNDFQAVGLIAQSSSISGNRLIVKIRSDVTFSDGSPLTVTDIVSSYEKAKQCDRYSDDLTNFTDAKPTDNYEVTFTFTNFEVDLINLLTFPIIKTTGSEDDLNTSSLEDSDSIFRIPLGSGRYYLNKNKNNVYCLCCNTRRLGGYFPKHRNIGLVRAADPDQIAPMYSLGRINFIMDYYPNGEYTQIIGKASPITMPNFVYLVCNMSNSVLQDVNVKKAISYALDRKELCDFCFIGNAVPTELPFHPYYYKTVKNKPEDKTYTDAIELLENDGYENVNNVYNFRYNTEDSSKVLEFSLAVCKNNQFKVIAAQKIKEQLAKVNIRINIFEYAEEDFFNVVSTSSYDMYLGETRLKNNLNFSRFFTSGSTVAYGINSYSDSAVAYLSYQNGKTDIGLFVNTFKDDLPFIPLLYKNGCVFSTQSMTTENKAIVTDCYHNTAQWANVND